VSAPVLFAFGEGVLGQTYLLRYRGSLYEARMSYFRQLGGLAVTIGQRAATPATFDDAVGRLLRDDEALACFGCHAPSAVTTGKLDLARAQTGLTCESCHGPGAQHVAVAKTMPKAEDQRIFNPGKLAGDELTQQFCGSCHLSFEQTMGLPDRGGPTNVRFQAFRLFNSRGHRGPDTRSSCVACHDPHLPLEQRHELYDAACTACHTLGAAPSGSKPAKVCPVSAAKCVTCHMPTVELPGMHGKFTDHWIRIPAKGREGETP